MPQTRRVARLLHPGAWWAWAIGMATVAMRTTNVIVLALVLAVVAFVVTARKQDAPWARSFSAFLRLGAGLIALRLALSILFGARVGEHELVGLPSVELPGWMAGVSVGGPITVELLVESFRQGLRLAAVLACFGAVNSLCSPARLLRALPAVLYEAGVVVTIALSFGPQAVTTVGRVREARLLRGRPTRGLRGLRGIAIPVLEGGLESSIALAASMDARGYGRRADLTGNIRRLTTVCTGGGLLVMCIGVYAVLDAGTARTVGLPLIALGVVGLAVAMFIAGRRVPRTRHRPDRFAASEWLVTISGVVAFAGVTYALAIAPLALDPPVVPLSWPDVPLVAFLAVLVGATPAFVAPPPPSLRDATDPTPVGTVDDVPVTTRVGA